MEDLVPKVKIAEKPLKDFFGRVRKEVKSKTMMKVVVEEGGKREEERDLIIGDCGVVFKFNEGYSNAVRRPLMYSDLTDKMVG